MRPNPALWGTAFGCFGDTFSHEYLNVMPTAELYHDRWIRCTDTELVIRGYYFPFGHEKRIPYDTIREVATVEMGMFSGKGRLWGTASPRYWAHLDLRRPRKSTALVLDVGRRMKPFITPDDPSHVRDIVGSHHRAGPFADGDPTRGLPTARSTGDQGCPE